MRKLLNLSKTLLVAAALCVGASAWGQISTWTYSSTNTYGAEFSGSTSGVVSVQLGATSEASTWAIFNVNNKNRGVYSTNAKTWDATNTAIPTGGTFMIVKPQKNIHFSLSVYNGGSKQQIKYSDLETPTKATTLNGGYNVNALAEKDIEVGTLTANHTYYVYMGSTDWAIKSFTAKSIESYTIHFQDANGTTIKDDVVRSDVYGSSVTATEEDMSSIEYEGKTYAYTSGNEAIILGSNTNEITLVFAAATIKNYTIKYVDDSTIPVTIKEDVVVESYIDAEVTASGNNFPSYITFNDVRYKYASGNKTITVSETDAENVITLVYTTCNVYSYSVNAYDSESNLLETISSGNWTEGDDVIYVTYPQYILFGTTLYNIANNGNAGWYRTSFTPNKDEYEYVLNYTNGTISDVVFYTEGESVSGTNSAENKDRASNSKMGYTSNSSTYVNATSISPGKYKIYLRGVNGNSAARTANFKVGESIVFTFSIGNGTNQLGNSDDFTVYETSTLAIACDGSTSSGIDWFYVVKTGDATVSKTITSAGWATYCSPYALNLASATGLTDAYIVTGGTSGVLTKTSVKNTTVPANTGLLLKGSAGTVTVPVVASSSTDVTTNKLVGVTADTSIDAEKGWVLMASPKLGFYKNSEAFTVGANTAYLPVGFDTTVGGEARSFFALFDEEANGINTVNSEEIKANSFFDLQGRRVTMPTKGLYIVNGKKVIK